MPSHSATFILHLRRRSRNCKTARNAWRVPVTAAVTPAPTSTVRVTICSESDQGFLPLASIRRKRLARIINIDYSWPRITAEVRSAHLPRTPSTRSYCVAALCDGSTIRQEATLTVRPVSPCQDTPDAQDQLRGAISGAPRSDARDRPNRRRYRS